MTTKEATRIIKWSKEKITESIENYLSANDWENSPLKDKELLKNIQL